MNITPVSTETQRWARGVESRQALRESGFHPADYSVRRISKGIAEPFVIEHHYSHSPVCTVRAYELRRTCDDTLVGVALFSNPYAAIIHNLWGWPEYDQTRPERPYRGNRWLRPSLPELGTDAKGNRVVVRGGALELGRLVLLDMVPGRAETWFLGECFELLAADGFYGIVSFADPFPRHAQDGRRVFPGHVGWIYQAHNAVFTGRGEACTLDQLPDATTINARSSVKIRKTGRETGGPNQISRLVAWGASVPAPDENIAEWLIQAKRDIGVTQIEHPGNFRYAWTIGTRRERHQMPVLTSAQAYPKSVDLQLDDAFAFDDLEVA